MKQAQSFTIGLLIFLGSVLFLSCSKSESDIAESANVNGSIHGTAGGTIHYTTKVTMQNSAFSPASVTVMETGSILWVNNDGVVHTVTADNGSFDSGDIQPGSSYGKTFTTIGPHPYHCKYHLEMTGLVKCVTK